MGDGGAGLGNGAGGRWEETDLIDETDGIDAILRDEVTAAAAEPSEHRTGECARRAARVDYENDQTARAANVSHTTRLKLTISPAGIS